MPKGVCDAVITDGFTGNIAPLKLIEGTASVFRLLKRCFTKALQISLPRLL